jgi:hypothetical protein
MARLVLVFLAAVAVFIFLMQRHETLAHPAYKTIVSIVVHAHHHAALVPVHQ